MRPRVKWGAMRHPLDPPHMHAGANRFGKMVAQGLLDRSDARVAVLVAVGNAVDGGATVDLSGLQARLVWALDDATRSWTLRRARVRHEIERLFFDGGAAGLKSTALLQSAHDLNAQHGTALLRHEVRSAAEQAAAAYLRQRQGRRRYV